MGKVIVVAEFAFAPGRAEEGLELLGRTCAATHARDAGCELYALHRVEGDPERAVIVGKWASRQALDDHAASEHVRRFADFDGLAEDPKVLLLAPTGAGDPAKALL